MDGDARSSSSRGSRTAMSDATVLTVVTTASLDDVDAALEDARERAREGDDDLARWLEDVERGRASVVQLCTCATVACGSERFDVRVDNHGVWVEHAPHPAVAAKQIQETATKDVESLTGALRERGVAVTVEDVERMLFDVVLGPDLLERMQGRSASSAPRARVVERY